MHYLAPGSGTKARPAALLLPEARRELGGELLLGMQDLGLGEELCLGFDVLRVGHATVNGADRGTLLLVEETHALRALLGHDVVHVLGERGLRLTLVLEVRTAFVDR